MTAPAWPRRGCCGACARPAIAFPSGNWKHENGPCRARSQPSWWIDDLPVRVAARFIPEGEPLPDLPASVRELLAAEADALEAS